MIIASLGPSELFLMQRYLERFDCNNFIDQTQNDRNGFNSLSKSSSSHQESTSKRQGYIEGVEIFLNDRVERCYIHFLNTGILWKTVQSNIHVKAQSKLLVFSILQEPQKLTFI